MRDDLIERLRTELVSANKHGDPDLADLLRDTLAALEAAREDGWRVADVPPDGEMGFWTKEVITVSNYGTVCTLAYFHDPEGGVWQRPSRYCRGEEVMTWRPMPAIDQARGKAGGEVEGG